MRFSRGDSKSWSSWNGIGDGVAAAASWSIDSAVSLQPRSVFFSGGGWTMEWVDCPGNVFQWRAGRTSGYLCLDEFSWWFFYGLYQGKSPLSHQFGRICLELFPSIEQAHPSMLFICWFSVTYLLTPKAGTAGASLTHIFVLKTDLAPTRKCHHWRLFPGGCSLSPQLRVWSRSHVDLLKNKSFLKSIRE